MSYQHARLAAGRWRTLTLVEQLANVGSEVARARRPASTGAGLDRATGARGPSGAPWHFSISRSAIRDGKDAGKNSPARGNSSATACWAGIPTAATWKVWTAISTPLPSPRGPIADAILFAEPARRCLHTQVVDSRSTLHPADRINRHEARL